MEINTMSPEQTELFHLGILRVLDQNGTRFGLGIEAIRMRLTPMGFTATAGDTNKALEYLEDPAIGFVATIHRGHFNPANQTWKITAPGTNELRRRGY